MTKLEFIEALKKGLQGLPQADIDRSVEFYSEMIDDRMEEGLSEEEAVKAVGSVDDAVNNILKEIPLPKIVKEKVRPKRVLSVWEVVLIILGFPLWFPLLAAFFSVILAVVVALWSVIVSLYAVDLSLLLAGVGCIFGSVITFIFGGMPLGLVILAAGLILGGLAVLFFLLFNVITKGFLWLHKQFFLALKRSIIGKGSAK